MLERLISVLLAMMLTFTGVPQQTDEIGVGSNVSFGYWPQNRHEDARGNTYFVPEPITWTVLAVEDNKALIITDRSIDAQPYYKGKTDYYVKWENCTLRTWLNDKFLNNAFTERERRHIKLTHVVNGNESAFYVFDQGPDTDDYVFILSPNELRMYYPGFVWNQKNIPPRASGTNYAFSQGKGRQVHGDYWVRSPGHETPGTAAVVGSTGNLHQSRVNEICCVRPAMWVDIRALDPAEEEKTSWTEWLSEDGGSAANEPETAVNVTVTAKSVCIRDAAGNPLEYLPTDTKFKVTGYDAGRDSFTAKYKGTEGYIKGAGLNYSPDQLKKLLEE